ncbi:MAG: PorT family protein [Prevotella sp.]|nr:PorT family protein [Prevotella sp.]
MKKLVLIVACALCVLTASAQSERESEGVTWGVRAGLNVANQHDDGENAGSKAGFHVGVVVDIPVVSKYFYIQPGLYFTQKGFKYTEADGYSKYTEKVTPSYIEIPVLLSGRYAFNDKIQAQVNFGPYFAVGVAGKYKEKYSSKNNKEEISCDYFGDDGLGGKRFDCGLSIGAGITFVKHYYIGFQYEIGLTDAYSYETIKNRNCMISIGYNF